MREYWYKVLFVHVGHLENCLPHILFISFRSSNDLLIEKNLPFLSYYNQHTEFVLNMIDNASDSVIFQIKRYGDDIRHIYLTCTRHSYLKSELKI